MPTSPFPVWEEYKLKELDSMTEESCDNWCNYLEGHEMETFEEMIHYKDSHGKAHEATIRVIMSHVINHSTYHRGQIALKLRELNIAPPPTDFIVYQRI